MMRGAILFVLFGFAVAAHAQITPEVTCWREDTSRDRTTIVFGYTNAGAGTSVPKGAQNFVTPPPDEQGQPSLFAASSSANAFTMSIDTSDEANVSWTVNASVVYFNRALAPPCVNTMCLCPSGAVGDQGPRGPAGPVGLPGIAGVEGARGDAGADGIAGARGEAGPAGAAGAPGPAGIRGEPGEMGPAGDRPAGAAGAKGAVGDAGERGAMGPVGPQGETGDRGAAGAPGDRGAVGETGALGERGARGDQGAAGAGGARGPRGPAGQRGPQGVFGAMGATGDEGPAGVDAFLPIRANATGDASSLFVMATITARANTTGSLQILVDDVPRGVSFPVASQTTTIPIVTTIPVSAGDHVVHIAATNAEILASSLTVLPIEETSVKQRSVRH